MNGSAGLVRRGAASLAAALAVLALAPAVARASITVGSDLSETPVNVNVTCAPAPSPCTNLLVAVNVGNLYPVSSPATGTVTAFTIRSGSAATLTFRLVSIANQGQQATGAGTGPTVTLPGPGTFTFAANLPIQHGTYLGMDSSLHRAYEGLPCTDRGATLLYNPVLTDGGALEPTDANSICELLVQATIDPSNVFRIGKLALNKKRGRGTLKVTVPGPGELIVAGRNVQGKLSGAVGTKVKQAGPLKVELKPVGRGRTQMRKSGRTRSKLKLSYTPTGGAKSVQRKKVTLKRKG